jgi:hypothetical protein
VKIARKCDHNIFPADVDRVSEARRKADVAAGSSSVVSSGSGSYFRLDQHLDQLVFGTDEDLVIFIFFPRPNPKVAGSSFLNKSFPPQWSVFISFFTLQLQMAILRLPMLVVVFFLA